VDNLQVELLKNRGDEALQWIWQVISKIRTTNKLPDDWKLAVICRIHKKGYKQDCNNYRGISLLNVTYKIFSNCNLVRIKEKSVQVIGDYQGDYRVGRLTIDQIFIIRPLYQKT